MLLMPGLSLALEAAGRKGLAALACYSILRANSRFSQSAIKVAKAPDSR